MRRSLWCGAGGGGVSEWVQKQRASVLEDKTLSLPLGIAIADREAGRRVPDYRATTYWHDMCHDAFNAPGTGHFKEIVEPVNIASRDRQVKVLESDVPKVELSAYQRAFGNVPGRRIVSAPVKRRDLVDHATHVDLLCARMPCGSFSLWQ